MCGITGIYNFKKKEVDKKLLLKMTEIIKHRGPDNQGIFVDENIGLGYRRLSIIDTFEQKQPILHTKDKNYWISFNGEIYNYLDIKNELIKKGHSFYTKTDTEVVLHAYQEYGYECVKLFNGMFAFAIFDKVKDCIFLARDRLGIKPLYYYCDAKKLTFSSEMKSILEDDDVVRIVNKEAIVDYITIQNVFGDKTFIEGVKLLLPGHYMVVQNNAVVIKEYWDLVFQYETLENNNNNNNNKNNDNEKNNLRKELTEEDYVFQLKQLLQESVNMQMMSDVPLGCYLSGGIDSSSITILASQWKEKKGEKLDTFTGAFKDGGRFDERKFAKAVAEKCSTNYHEIFPAEDDLENTLTTIVWHLDEPRTPSGAFPIYFVSKEASKYVKVVLTGHGGDEILSGYPYNIPLYINYDFRKNPFKIFRFFSNISKAIKILGIKRLLGYCGYTLWNEGMKKTAKISFFNDKQKKKLFTKDFYNKISNYNCYEYVDLLTKKSNAKNIFDLYMYLDVKTYLPMLLLLEDKMDMANSLEGRVPILDHRIVEFSAGIPIEIKMKDMTPKYLLRKAMEKELPQIVLKHKKQGFPVPLDNWFRGKLKNYIYQILLEERTINRGYFNKEYVKKILDQNLLGLRNRKQEIWCLLTLELWHRLYIDKDKKMLEKVANI